MLAELLIAVTSTLEGTTRRSQAPCVNTKELCTDVREEASWINFEASKRLTMKSDDAMPALNVIVICSLALALSW